ncbi:hypothetical protein EVAR_33587_1 [Eumeta japonica]|uniref:Uncharacterized protein n=1 Tax=Eumeta variegata TaxID=151549 RepID=A0A4C1VIP8_EUMVA|nr:hypothetical protein EVAR_33587_1 [Eumeta japonica]
MPVAAPAWTRLHFDCSPDLTSVFSPGPACDSVPIRFYSRPVRNSLPNPAFNPDFATNHNSDLDEAGSQEVACHVKNNVDVAERTGAADAVKSSSQVKH